MQILQDTVERLLYILLFLMLIAVIIVGEIAYNDGQQIKHLVKTQTQLTAQVKNNQHNNSIALETFIRQGLICTATLSPSSHPTLALINMEGEKCFPNTPPIK